jgi:hypothetical protein
MGLQVTVSGTNGRSQISDHKNPGNVSFHCGIPYDIAAAKEA